MLDKNNEAFVIYDSFFELKIIIYPARKALMALLLAKEVTVLAKYLDFIDIFSKKSANVLLK